MKTFEQLCPRWSHLIKKHENKIEGLITKFRGKNLDIEDFATCVVGEAHGFKDDYQGWLAWTDECEDCVAFAISFSEDETITSKLITSFTRHFNEEHVKKK